MSAQPSCTAMGIENPAPFCRASHAATPCGVFVVFCFGTDWHLCDDSSFHAPAYYVPDVAHIPLLFRRRCVVLRACFGSIECHGRRRQLSTLVIALGASAAYLTLVRSRVLASVLGLGSVHEPDHPERNRVQQLFPWRGVCGHSRNWRGAQPSTLKLKSLIHCLP